MHFLSTDNLEGLLPIGGLQRLQPAICEDAGDRLAKIAIVVGDQQSWCKERHIPTLDWQATLGHLRQCKPSAGLPGQPEKGVPSPFLTNTSIKRRGQGNVKWLAIPFGDCQTVQQELPC